MGFPSNVITTPTAASLSLDEAASFLGVHPVTLQGLAKSGKVNGAKIGRAWRFLDVDLVAYLRATKIQTEATVSGLQSLLDEIKPNTPAHLTRRILE